MEFYNGSIITTKALYHVATIAKVFYYFIRPFGFIKQFCNLASQGIAFYLDMCTDNVTSFESDQVSAFICSLPVGGSLVLQ